MTARTARGDGARGDGARRRRAETARGDTAQTARGDTGQTRVERRGGRRAETARGETVRMARGDGADGARRDGADRAPSRRAGSPRAVSTSSLRRPPIECLFVSLFIFVSLFGCSCRSETSFTGLVTQGHRIFGLEEGARRARRRRNRWRQAMASLSRDAMPSTEGSAQPSTTLEVSSPRRARA